MVQETRRPGWEIATWRPFRELAGFDREFTNLFGRWRMPGEERGWMPMVDVFEKDDKFVVKAELPGMKEEDIECSVVGDSLIIKGEKKTESEVKEEDYYRSERTYGSFYRTISLPSTVDTDKIKASYEDGVLEITLPKLAEVKSKKIVVSKAASKK